jgi:uncharacterized delta-60 repeat protein
MLFRKETGVLKTTNLWKSLARLGLCLVLLAASLGTPTQSAYAAPGDLDPTFAGFGAGGVVTAGGAFSCACGMALQLDGRIVAAGSTTGISFLVMRYLSNGALDTTFDGDGRVTISNMQYVVRATSVAIQADGKIIVAGYTGTGDFLLIRLTTTGMLDTSFSGDGFVTTDFDGKADAAYAVLLQPNGKIVAAGRAWINGDDDFAAARYNPDGSLDTTFHNDGKVAIGFGGDEGALDIALQDDGKLVLVGGETGNPLNADFEVARLNSDGTLDASFDGDGKLETGFGATLWETGKAVAIQPDGRIVVAGDDRARALVARYHPDGDLDDSFDGDGLRGLDGLSGGLWDVALQPDGRILLLGTHQSPDGDFKFVLYRLNPNSSLDPTFDGDGRAFIDLLGTDEGRNIALQADGRIIASGTSGASHALVRLWPDGSFDTGGQQTLGFQDAYYGPGSDETAHGMALQADGRIVVAGTLANPGPSGSFAVARFLPDGQPDASFGEHGRTSFGLGNEVASAVAVQPDGKIVVGGYTAPGNAVNFMVARFNADGKKDDTFNFIGWNVLDFLGGNDIATALALAPDGKIVMAGPVFNGARMVFGAARFNSDGTVDTSFDLDGKQLFEFELGAIHWVSSVVVQPDRKIVVAGHVGLDFALVRFNENGSVDTTFGSGGKVLTNMGGTDLVNALALAPSGWLYAAGLRAVEDDWDFALAQYTPNGVLGDYPDGWAGGKAFADFGDIDEAFAIDWRSDGAIVAAGCTAGKFAWAQFPRRGLLIKPITGTTDFVGGNECALAVKFAGSNKIVAAGTQYFNDDANFALARFETTVNPNASVFRLFLPLVMR